MVYKQKRKKLFEGFTASLVIAANFFVILMLGLFAKNMVRAFSNWTEAQEINVFVAADQTQSEKEGLERLIFQYFEKSEVQSLSSQQTFALLKNEFGENQMPSFQKEFVDQFPSLYLLKRKNEREMDFPSIVKEIRNLPGVEEASFGLSWIERLAPLLMGAQGLVLLFFFLLVIAVGFVLKSYIGDRIRQSSETIRVMQFLGATRWQIQGPLFKRVIGMSSLALALAFLGAFFTVNYLNHVLIDFIGEPAIARNSFTYFNGSEIFAIFILLTVIVGAVSEGSIRKVQSGDPS